MGIVRISKGFLNNEDLERYRLVNLIPSSGDDEVPAIEQASDGSKPAFVLEDDIDDEGKVGSVVMFGETKVQVGTALDIGVWFMPDSDGKAIEATAGYYASGVIIEKATAEDDVVGCILFPSFYIPPVEDGPPE